MGSLPSNLVLRIVAPGLLMAAVLANLALQEVRAQVVHVPPHPAVVAPQAGQVLRAMARFFRNVRSLRTEVTILGEGATPHGMQTVAMRYVLALQRPDKFALVQVTRFDSPTVVCDGKDLYIFWPATMQYVQKNAPGSLESVDPADILEAGSGLGGILSWILQPDPYQAVIDRALWANYAGQDMSDGVRTQRVELIQREGYVEVWVQADRPAIRKVALGGWQTWTAGEAPEPAVSHAGSARGGAITLHGSDQYSVHNLRLWRLFARGGGPRGVHLPPAPSVVYMDVEGQVEPARDPPNVTMTFSNWLIDAELPDSAFRFTPPEGAVRVAADGQASDPADQDLTGQPLPPAVMNLMSGGQFATAKMKGKVLVLGFWSMAAPSSKAVLAAMAEITARYFARGVVVCAVNVGDAPAKVRQFLKEADLHVPVAPDPTGQASQPYGLKALPQVMIVDRRGIVRTEDVPLGTDINRQLQKDVEAVLAGRDLTAEKP